MIVWLLVTFGLRQFKAERFFLNYILYPDAGRVARGRELLTRTEIGAERLTGFVHISPFPAISWR